MKKFISIALAALTAVGLFGCSQDNAEDVSRISELEAQVGSLEASIAALESEKNGLDSQHSDAKAENETFAGENEQLSEVLSTAEEENETLEGRISELEALLAEADDYERIALSGGNTLLWNEDSLFMQHSDGRVEELQNKYVNSVAASPDGSKAVWTNLWRKAAMRQARSGFITFRWRSPKRC